MKTKLFVASIALASTLSHVTLARDSASSFRTWSSSAGRGKAVLTAVKMMGTLRCEDRETVADHKNDHKCDLEFVNDETGEVWNVKENQTLTSIHHSGNREIQAHIEAMRSPRYLLGGSYIEIKNLETISSETANADFTVETTSNPSHICSLDANWGKNQ